MGLNNSLNECCNYVTTVSREVWVGQHFCIYPTLLPIESILSHSVQSMFNVPSLKEHHSVSAAECQDTDMFYTYRRLTKVKYKRICMQRRKKCPIHVVIKFHYFVCKTSRKSFPCPPTQNTALKIRAIPISPQYVPRPLQTVQLPMSKPHNGGLRVQLM